MIIFLFDLHNQKTNLDLITMKKCQLVCWHARLSEKCNFVSFCPISTCQTSLESVGITGFNSFTCQLARWYGWKVLLCQFLSIFYISNILDPVGKSGFNWHLKMLYHPNCHIGMLACQHVCKVKPCHFLSYLDMQYSFGISISS